MPNLSQPSTELSPVIITLEQFKVFPSKINEIKKIEKFLDENLNKPLVELLNTNSSNQPNELQIDTKAALIHLTQLPTVPTSPTGYALEELKRSITDQINYINKNSKRLKNSTNISKPLETVKKEISSSIKNKVNLKEAYKKGRRALNNAELELLKINIPQKKTFLIQDIIRLCYLMSPQVIGIARYLSLKNSIKIEHDKNSKKEILTAILKTLTATLDQNEFPKNTEISLSTLQTIEDWQQFRLSLGRELANQSEQQTTAKSATNANEEQLKTKIATLEKKVAESDEQLTKTTAVIIDHLTSSSVQESVESNPQDNITHELPTVVDANTEEIKLEESDDLDDYFDGNLDDFLIEMEEPAIKMVESFKTALWNEAELCAQIKELQNKIEKLEGELRRRSIIKDILDGIKEDQPHHNTINELYKKLLKKEEEIKYKSNEINELSKKIDNKDLEIQNLRDKSDKLKENFTKLENQLKDEKQTTLEEIKKIQKERDAAQTQITESKEKLKALSQEKETVDQELKEKSIELDNVRQQLNAGSSANQQLIEQLDQLKTEKENLTKEKTDLAASHQDTITALKNEHAALLDQTEKLEEKAQTGQNELQELNNTLELMRTNAAETETKLQLLRQQLNERNSTNQELIGQLAKLKTEKEKLTKDKTNLETIHKNTITDLGNEHAALLDEKTEKLKQVEEQLKETTDKLNDLRTEETTLKQTLTESQQEKKRLKNKLDELTSDKKKLEEKALATQSDLQELNKNLESMQAERTKATQSVETLSSQLKQKESELSTLQNQLEAAQKEKVDLTQETNDLKNNNETLVTNYQTTVTDLKNNIEEQNLTIKTLTDESTRLKETISNLENKLKNQSQTTLKLTETQTALAEAQAQLKQTEENLQQALSEKLTTSNKLQKIENQLQDINQELQEKEDTVETLRTQLETAQQKMERLTQKISSLEEEKGGTSQQQIDGQSTMASIQTPSELSTNPSSFSGDRTRIMDVNNIDGNTDNKGEEDAMPAISSDLTVEQRINNNESAVEANKSNNDRRDPDASSGLSSIHEGDSLETINNTTQVKRPIDGNSELFNGNISAFNADVPSRKDSSSSSSGISISDPNISSSSDSNTRDTARSMEDTSRAEQKQERAIAQAVENKITRLKKGSLLSLPPEDLNHLDQEAIISSVLSEIIEGARPSNGLINKHVFAEIDKLVAQKKQKIHDLASALIAEVSKDLYTAAYDMLKNPRSACIATCLREKIDHQVQNLLPLLTNYLSGIKPGSSSFFSLAELESREFINTLKLRLTQEVTLTPTDNSGETYDSEETYQAFAEKIGQQYNSIQTALHDSFEEAIQAKLNTDGGDGIEQRLSSLDLNAKQLADKTISDASNSEVIKTLIESLAAAANPTLLLDNDTISNFKSSFSDSINLAIEDTLAQLESKDKKQKAIDEKLGTINRDDVLSALMLIAKEKLDDQLAAEAAYVVSPAKKSDLATRLLTDENFDKAKERLRKSWVADNGITEREILGKSEAELLKDLIEVADANDPNQSLLTQADSLVNRLAIQEIQTIKDKTQTSEDLRIHYEGMLKFIDYAHNRMLVAMEHVTSRELLTFAEKEIASLEILQRFVNEKLAIKRAEYTDSLGLDPEKEPILNLLNTISEKTDVIESRFKILKRLERTLKKVINNNNVEEKQAIVSTVTSSPHWFKVAKTTNAGITLKTLINELQEKSSQTSSSYQSYDKLYTNVEFSAGDTLFEAVKTGKKDKSFVYQAIHKGHQVDFSIGVVDRKTPSFVKSLIPAKELIKSSTKSMLEIIQGIGETPDQKGQGILTIYTYQKGWEDRLACLKAHQQLSSEQTQPLLILLSGPVTYATMTPKQEKKIECLTRDIVKGYEDKMLCGEMVQSRGRSCGA